MAERVTRTGTDPIDVLRHELGGIVSASRPHAYLVLDHSFTGPAPYARGTDGYGERYLLCSPAVLDELTDLLWIRLVACIDGIGPSSLPVYRRADLPDEWPRKWVRT